MSADVSVRRNPYQKTIYACFLGYIVQAIALNFAPLLFVTFRNQYGIPLGKITALITTCFVLQLAVDLASAVLIDRIGYRACMLAACAFVAAGLVGLTTLPELLPDAYAGLLLAVVLYAVGSGLLEVVVSPIVEACPNDHKAGTMSMLHGFYCWGSVAVVVLSTLFFHVFGLSNWKILALLWTLVPIAVAVLFLHTPIASLEDSGGALEPAGKMLRSGLFWIFFLTMVCAGACEQAVCQWASVFVETALNIPKSYCDLVGPALFSILMGAARTLYGRLGDRLPLSKALPVCAGLCAASYLLITLSSSPAAALAGMGLCGFSVGILWPGTYSMASASLRGGNPMFALLALGGDLGCTLGPTFVGFVSDARGGNLKSGILAAILFPAGMAILCVLRQKRQKRSA